MTNANRTERTLMSARAEKPVRYTLAARWADPRAGRVDGRANLLATWLDEPTPTTGRDIRSGNDTPLTPYLGALDHEFQTRAAKVNLDAQTELRSVVSRCETIRASLASAEERVLEAAKRLEEFGVEPGEDELHRRNAAEAAQPDAVITGRNSERFAKRRSAIVADETKAREHLRSLQDEYAQLGGVARARRLIAVIRVERLHAHALRRSRAYERRLVLLHERGSELIPLLAVNRPALPEWVHQWRQQPTGVTQPSSV